MDWLSNPNVWIGLITLTLLEIVLGVDNIVFLTILTGKLPAEVQNKARQLGLILAVIPRVLLLLAIGWVMKLTAPLFHLPFLSETDPHLPKGPMGITGQDLVFLLGGLFLLFKSVKEIHHKLEGADEPRSARVPPSFSAVMVQIMLVNIVFSLDSVITAVGMVDKEKVGGLSVAIGVMIAAVLLSTVFMIFTARPVGEFVDNHPTVKMLALAFLILIGVNLLAEGFHQHIPKGYTYFAMAFAIGVEMLNLRMKAKTAQPVHLHKTLR